MKNIVLLLSFLLFNAVAGKAIIFVKAGATGARNGTSWADAFDDLQDAIDAAHPYDSIFVAAGVYKPTRTLGGSSDPRDKTFLLKNEVAIFGGFDGTVVLSGNIGNLSDSLDNCYHVVTGIGLSSPYYTRLEKLTITEGNANGTDSNNVGGVFIPRNVGGGIYQINCGNKLYAVSVTRNTALLGGAGMNNDNCIFPIIDYCSFNENILNGKDTSRGGGAGMRNANSNPVIISGSFRFNIARGTQGGAGMRNEASSPRLEGFNIFLRNTEEGGRGGAGIYNANGSNPEMIEPSFSRNRTTGRGGAIYNERSSPFLQWASFSRNIAETGGGAIENDNESNPYIEACTFSSDSTMGNGGAIENRASSPIINNCSFQRSYAAHDGGAIYNYGNSAPQLYKLGFVAARSGNNGGAVCNRQHANPEISNCMFGMNRSGNNGGAMASYAKDATGTEPSNPILTNITMADNYAAHSGGGIFDDGFGMTSVRNSIVSTNKAASGEENIGSLFPVSTGLDHTIIDDQYFESGLIPPVAISGKIFLDTGRRIYTLAKTSFAIDRGDSSFYAAGASPDLSAQKLDFQNQTRTQGKNTDLGAAESCADMIVPVLTISASPSGIVTAGTTVRYTTNFTGISGYFEAKVNWIVDGRVAAFYRDTFYLYADTRHTVSAEAWITYADDPCLYVDTVKSNELELLIPVSVVPALEKPAGNFTVIPNPNTGDFTVTAANNSCPSCTILVSDLSGRTVHTTYFDELSTKTIKLSGKLPAGTYFLSVGNDSQVRQVTRLVVQ